MRPSAGRGQQAGIRSNRESLLQYYRPLCEDGELEYEFFYSPGQTEVHPALDRMAFLLQPYGINVHWLTDGQFERTDISSDNAEQLRGTRPVPLKSDEWNALRLKIQGEGVTIVVNGVQVAAHKLEHTNLRTFGLFRYSDQTGVRVRNVMLRGQWSSKLPLAAGAEVAAPEE